MKCPAPTTKMGKNKQNFQKIDLEANILRTMLTHFTGTMTNGKLLKKLFQSLVQKMRDTMKQDTIDYLQSGLFWERKRK